MPMNPTELKSLLAAEKAAALAAVQASKLSGERTDAMSYYLGDMSKDMPSADGRSQAVSTDVADTIEGLMPQLMEIFAGSDEVVRFDPVGPEDVAAAEQETEYVNHVFMQRNAGFLVLYSFIKDALLSKDGIVKVFWEESEQEERETYLDQSDDAFAMLLADPDVEIVEHSEHEDPAFAPASRTAQPSAAPLHSPSQTGVNALMDAGGGPPPAQPGDDPAMRPKLHDVTIATKTSHECARVVGVPPEEFGISRLARSIKEANYCFHEVIKSEHDLIDQGYDAEQVRKLPSYTLVTNTETYARDTVNESIDKAGDEAANKAARLIKVTEHYVRMDYEGDGKAALYRVTTGGEGQILERADGPDVVREDFMPFAAMTPVIVTHRFFGRSIADLVMDIQRIKTALLRALLDNAYLANNPRVEVAESNTTETTLDDLLVSRPGGIVRTKTPGGLNWQTVPTIGNHVYPLLEYQDATREWRTGVTRQAQGIDANALANQSATAVNQVFTAAQARIRLIGRIFAETGIRDLFALLHAVIRRNGSKAQTVRLRNQWVTVDPRDWRTRNDMTINVALGTGSKGQQLAHMMALIGLQKEAVAAGMTNIVTPKHLYNSAKEVARLLDHKDTDKFFSDPDGQPQVAPRPDPKMMEVQAKAALDQQHAQTIAAAQNNKIQGEMALEQHKFELHRQLALDEHAMKREKHHMDLAATVARHASPPAQVGPDGQPLPPEANAGLAPLMTMLMEHMRAANAPKRVVRDAQGRVSHVEPMVGP